MKFTVSSHTHDGNHMEYIGTDMETVAEPATIAEPQSETPSVPDVSTRKQPRKEKLPKLNRAAHCLDCSNEWVASNGNAGKPSRCPVCMSRHVTWKDEWKQEQEQKQEKDTMTKTADTTETEGYDDYDIDDFFSSDDGGEFTYEDAERAVPKIPMQAIVFIVGGLAVVAGICFLVRKGSKRNLSTPQHTQAQEPTNYLPPIPSIGGGLL